MTESPDPTAAEVREAAVRLLARREHSASELVSKLTRKGWPAALVDEVVAELAGSGLQSDSRFAESFARQRAERHYGPRRIEAELNQRGVSRPLVRDAIEALEIDFFETARDFYLRRYAQPGEPLEYRERVRRAQAMARRGFDPEHYRDLVDD